MKFLFCILISALSVAAQSLVLNPYRFSAGGGGGGSTNYVETERFAGVDTNTTTQVFTLTQPIGSGKRAVFAIGWEAGTSPTLSSVADSKGNTWTVRGQKNYSTSHNSALADALISSALAAGDTITITFASAQASTRAGILGYVQGVNTTQPDATQASNTFDNTESITHTTVNANSLIVGAILIQAWSNSAQAASINFVNGASFTQSGSDLNFGTVLNNTAGLRLYVVWKLATTATAYSAGGQFQRGGVQNNESFSLVSASYKP